MRELHGPDVGTLTLYAMIGIMLWQNLSFGKIYVYLMGSVSVLDPAQIAARSLARACIGSHTHGPSAAVPHTCIICNFVELGFSRINENNRHACPHVP